MTKSPKLAKASRSVGPNIVRAWFDTVINPLLQALKNEQTYLEKGDCTWRFRPGGLEALRSVRAHLDLEAWDNLEQIAQFYRGVKLAADSHDKNVESLSERCALLQQRVQNSPELLDIYQRVTMAKSLAGIGYSSLEQVFGAYPPSDHLALLAQYIVNQTGYLPDHYHTARLWNKFRKEFLAVLARPSIRIHMTAADRAREKLLFSVKLLLRILKEKRLELSLEHDVPYVTALRSFVEDAR